MANFYNQAEKLVKTTDKSQIPTSINKKKAPQVGCLTNQDVTTLSPTVNSNKEIVNNSIKVCLNK